MKYCLVFLVAFVLGLSTAIAQSTIFVVRHAEKAETAGPDPELSEAGHARAETLARTLKDADITTIYASEFKRTQETAAPLAKALGIKVVNVPAKDTATLTAKLRTMHGNILVVGHGDTIPDLLKALGISTPINIAENDYDELLVILLDGTPRFIHLHYR